MRDKVVLITGANSGVGFVTASELAKLGAAGLFPRLTKLLFQSAEKAVVALVHLASSAIDVAARLWRISAQLVGAPAELQIPVARTVSELSFGNAT